jgi:hypothetical protein
MRNPRLATGAILLLLALPARADHHMGWLGSADLGLGYDDNSSNAVDGPDQRGNGVVAGNANLDFQWRPTLYTGLVLRGGLGAEGYTEDSKLSNGKVSLLARVAHRPAGGFYMPTGAVWLSTAYREFGSELRSGIDLRAGTYLMMPITTAIGMRVSAGLAERQADSKVFDLSTVSYGVDFDWRVASRVTTYLGYQLIDGDLVTSSSLAPVGGYGIYEEDDAFEGFWAYRLDARTQVATVGLNFALSRSLSIDAQLQRATASAEYAGPVTVDLSYERLQGTIGALLRF